MVKSLLTFTLFLHFSIHASTYRWLEGISRQDRAKRETWLSEQDLNKENYLKKVRDLDHQLILRPYLKNRTLRSRTLKNQTKIELIQLSSASDTVLRVDGVTIFSKSINLTTQYNFNSFSLDPEERFIVIPVYRSGSTDQIDLYIYDLLLNQIIHREFNLTNQSFTWLDSGKLYVTLGEGQSRFSFIFNAFEKTYSQSFQGVPKTLRNGEIQYFLSKNSLNEETLFIKKFGEQTFQEIEVDTLSLREKVSERALIFVDDNLSVKEIMIVPYSTNERGELTVGLAVRTSFKSNVKGSIQGFRSSQDYFLFETMYGEERRYSLFNYQGKEVLSLKSPKSGSLISFKSLGDDLTFNFQSPVNSRLEVTYSIGDKWDPQSIDDKLMIDNDGHRYITEYLKGFSNDGTMVPNRIIYRESFGKTKSSPILMEVYGGFSQVTSFKPRYSWSNYLFVKEGGILSGPAVRGGKEFGAGWHQAAAKRNKLKTYEDVESSISHMHSLGIGSAKTSALMGWSNGGLTVNAVLTRRPELFNLMIPGNGISDLLRKDVLDRRFNRGWAYEYGDHSNTNDLNFLKSFSPLLKVQKKRSYPMVFTVVGDADSRVNPAHSYKMTHALLDYQQGARPIILYKVKDSGHWPTSVYYMGKGSLKVIYDLYSVIFKETGLSTESLKASVLRLRSSDLKRSDLLDLKRVNVLLN